MSPIASRLLAGVGSLSLFLAACGPDWDALDPAMGEGAGEGTSSTQTAASTSASASGSGGATTGAAGSGGCVNVDDMNDCTQDECVAGSPLHDPLAVGSACNSGGGSVCDGAGTCVTCNSVSDCHEGGCKEGGLCKKGSCFMVGNTPAGAACSADAGTVCNGAGQCVGCITDTDCTAPETCGGSGTPNQCG